MVKDTLSKEILKELTTEVVGEDAVKVAFYLKKKKNVSEFEVSKHIKRDIHETRALLYKLFENNITSFERKKDKTKGWYVCYWDLEPEKIIFEYEKLKRGKIEVLNNRLEREKSNDFYMCKNACARVDFDTAFLKNFKCEECGMLLSPVDNSRTIEFLGERIKELKTQITSST